MARASAVELCAVRALEAARRIRAAVHAVPLSERGRRTPTALKPAGGLTMHVDQVGEAIGIAALERLSAVLGLRIMLLVDAARGQLLPLGAARGPEVIFAQLDAVDGTIKVGGLGNDPSGAAVRVANDGNWGVTFAFTAPTRLAVEALAYRDFTIAVVVDGNPPQHRAAPREVVVLPDAQGEAMALDVGDLPAVSAALRRAPRVHTSTADALDQTLVYLDGFQAHDRETRQPGDEALATALYDRLCARHDGGAFDITRSYGNLSAILRVMLGWRGAPPWRESQGGGFVVINENLPNLIPSVPIVAAAGGTSIDLDGRPLLTRRLSEGRSSVVHAANPALRRQLLALVGAARRGLPRAPSI